MASLLPQHADLLAASGITNEVQAARGYRSITDPVEAIALGFAEYQAYVPALLVPVHSVAGGVALYQLRPDNPRVRDGKPIKYETPAGSRMVIDVPPAVRPILGDPSVPLIVTEGVKKGDAAVSQGGNCIALLGVFNFRGKNEQGGTVALPDWESIALNDRDVSLCFDSDVMTNPNVKNALDRLTAFLSRRGAHVRHIFLPPAADGGKQGLDDFLFAGHMMEEIYTLARDASTEEAGDTSPRQSKRPPQRDDLIALADEAELFHTPQGIPYATITNGSHRETHRLTSRGFKEWLAHRYYREYGGSANTQAVQDAVSALAGCARYDGEEHPVFIRLAEHDGAIYLDLGDAAWRVVEIDRDGWRIVTDSTVRFRRTRGMLALPTPANGGTLKTLRRFINLTDADWILFVAALVAAMRPRGPYPILGVFGEQGSAKSTLARIMRSLTDPNAAPLRTMPRDERDLMIAATNGWHLAFDNVSTLPIWLSDALCRLATGGGFATRELYADDEETIIDAQRPVIVNGITDFVTRSDLLDRLIPLNLRRIPDDQRQSEAELWLAFEQERRAIIGALLTAVSMAIRNLPTIRLHTMPRMADFALWVSAAAPALGFTADDFLRAYSHNRASAHELAVEASPLATALTTFVKSKGEWHGTATNLLGELVAHTDEATRKQRGWPADAARLSGELKRSAPNLRAGGLSVEWPKQREIHLQWLGVPDQEEQDKTALRALSALRDTDEANDSKGNKHNAGDYADDAASVTSVTTALRVEAIGGTGINADDADDAEIRPRSLRPSNVIDLASHTRAASDD